MYVCMYVCMHVCMYACIYICVYVCVCIYMLPTFTSVLCNADFWSDATAATCFYRMLDSIV